MWQGGTAIRALHFLAHARMEKRERRSEPHDPRMLQSHGTRVARRHQVHATSGRIGETSGRRVALALIQVGGFVVAVMGIAAALSWETGCAEPERPPNHPAASMRDRAAMRVELVALVVPDEPRAAKIKTLYQEIDALAGELDAKRAQRLEQLRALDAQRDVADAEIETAMQGLRVDGHEAFVRYVSLQTQLRELLTPDEFRKLDAAR